MRILALEIAVVAIFLLVYCITLAIVLTYACKRRSNVQIIAESPQPKYE